MKWSEWPTKHPYYELIPKVNTPIKRISFYPRSWTEPKADGPSFLLMQRSSLLTVLASSLVVPLAACGGGTIVATTPTVSPTTLYVTPNHVDLPVGSTQQFLAFSPDKEGNLVSENGTVLAWTSIPASVATVSDRGLVTVAAKGTAEGQVTLGTAQATFAISSDADAQVFSAVSIEQVGVLDKAAQWKALVTSPDGVSADVTANGVWSSSDSSIISIGVLTGTSKFLKPSGKAYITFQYGPLSSTKGVVLGIFTP